MTAITKAFFDVLNGDATLTALLGTFNSDPSIFTKTPLPAGLKLKDHGPYIVTTGETTSQPGTRDVKNAAGLEIVRDIRCYQDDKGDSDIIERISERVKLLFHRISIPIVGFTVHIAEATGPIEADEEDALGRVITVRLVMSEP